MTDTEARIFVVQSVVEALRGRFPAAEPSKMHDAAAHMVNAIVNEYLRCLLLSPKDERTPS